MLAVMDIFFIGHFFIQFLYYIFILYYTIFIQLLFESICNKITKIRF